MTLLGPTGAPISSRMFKKADPPKTGPAFGNWAGRDVDYLTLPGGGIVQFDLNRLTLTDYRAMRDHYQVNASQSVLTFMVHQADWHIEADNKKVADFCTEVLKKIWTRLIRSVSQAFWAGFSPNALEWENEGSRLVISKIKDLIPEECRVHWKEVDGYAPPGHAKPKFKIYDGIDQWSSTYPIPVENSLWYALLMENGDYYGRKLLRSAFVPWFFSLLIHLFSNRYYERFGEPIPIGRAPYDSEVEVDGKPVKGNKLMLNILESLRSRSVVVLPNDRRTYDGETSSHPDYEVEYLEAQMRGADFDRYITRLDEEISLALFTPLLILRTADVGSYNLGIGHTQMYLWMLNALLQDMREYFERYLLTPLVRYNFGQTTELPKLIFRKMGKENVETIRALLAELTKQGRTKLNMEEISQITGFEISEVKQIVTPDGDGSDDDDERVARDRPGESKPKGPDTEKPGGGVSD